MDRENFTLIELAEDYLWNIRVGIYGLQRVEIHQSILKKLGLEMERYPEKILEANKMLHNLDREIGFNVEIEYDESDIHKMAKKLRGKLENIKGG